MLLDPLPNWIPSEAWEGWLEMRKAKRIPMTPRAFKIAVNALERLREQGEPLEHVLDQSAFKGWSGLFPVGGWYYEMIGEKRERESALILKLRNRDWAD